MKSNEILKILEKPHSLNLLYMLSKFAVPMTITEISYEYKLLKLHTTSKRLSDLSRAGLLSEEIVEKGGLTYKYYLINDQGKEIANVLRKILEKEDNNII